MKKKLLFSSAIVPALVATGAMGQVVNFENANNYYPLTSSINSNLNGYWYELFAGQGAYADPGNDVWNGFGNYGQVGFSYSFVYQGGWFYGANGYDGYTLIQPAGNPGNPYAAYNPNGQHWVTSTGPALFDYTTGSATNSGNSDSSGHWTPIQLSVEVNAFELDTVNFNTQGSIPNGTPAFLNLAATDDTGRDEVFVLQNVPPGNYGLYLYGANPNVNLGTAFAVSSGNAHNGISATVNAEAGSPNQTFVEGQNFVIFENVTPDGGGNITITASPNNSAKQVDVNGFQLIFNPPPTAVAMTAAQNVFAGATASFSFSPAFAASPSFQWQSVIGGVTNNLTDGGGISGSKTTNLTISAVSSANAGLYQCVIATSTATNTSLAAPLTILTSTATRPLMAGDTSTTAGYILTPGDVATLSDFNNTLGPPFNSVPLAFNMTDTSLVDDTLFQYVSFGANGSTAPFAGPVGFTVTPNIKSTIVTGMRLFASSRYPEDDPADFLLEGSDDGTTFTPIAGGLLNLPARRNAAGGVINIINQVLQEVDFPNTTAYTTYRLTFTNVVDNSAAFNGLQIAEIQLLGSLPPIAPTIVQQPPTNLMILAGQTLNVTPGVSGPGPLSYQWYFNGSKQLLGQTSASLTLTNITAADSGQYTCRVSNPFGNANSVTVNLTVVTPTPYQQTLLTFNPAGYWPMNETNGIAVYDYANGYNGTYVGIDFTLQQPGPPNGGFGSNNYAALLNQAIPPTTYVDVPGAPLNFLGPVTLVAWVQQLAPQYQYAFLMSHGYGNSYFLDLRADDYPAFGESGAEIQDPTELTDSNWHMIVGTSDGTNGYCYFDGVLVASGPVNPVPGNSADLWLGGSYDYASQGLFIEDANMAHLAVFPRPLSSDQVLQLYEAAGVAPVVSQQPPAAVSIGLGAGASFTAEAFGTPTLGYQWLHESNPASGPEYSGETTPTLTITGASLADSGNYFLVVSNSYGSVTSQPAVVTVYETPVIVTPFPDPSYAFAGGALNLSVSEIGAPPFTNAWYANGVQLSDGGRISGATTTTLTIAGVTTNDAGSYEFKTTNADGTASTSGSVIVLPSPGPISFAGFTNWSIQSNGVSAAQGTIISNDVIEMTDTNGGEETAFFYDFPVYVGSFTASYVYRNLTRHGGDGFTFIIQNAPTGAGTLGTQVNGGSGVGYSPIAPSLGLCTEIYPVHNGPGITVQSNGASPGYLNGNNYIQPLPVIINGGDAITYDLTYDGNTLHVTLTDPATETTFSTAFEVGSITNYVGGYAAYVGFGAGTGGAAATQTLADFSYTPIPVLTASTSGSSVILSWDASFGNFQIQKSSNLSIPGAWTTIPGPYNIVGTQAQETITSPTGNEFYRLEMTP